MLSRAVACSGVSWRALRHALACSGVLWRARASLCAVFCGSQDGPFPGSRIPKVTISGGSSVPYNTKTSTESGFRMARFSMFCHQHSFTIARCHQHSLTIAKAKSALSASSSRNSSLREQRDYTWPCRIVVRRPALLDPTHTRVRFKENPKDFVLGKKKKHCFTYIGIFNKPPPPIQWNISRSA